MHSSSDAAAERVARRRFTAVRMLPRRVLSLRFAARLSDFATSEDWWDGGGGAGIMGGAMTIDAAARARLSEDEIAFFRREGYLLPRRELFPRPKFEALRAHFEEKIARLAEGVSPESMDTPHFTDPKLFEWLFADEVLDMIEPLIGPDIALFSSHFIAKPAGGGRRVPWHGD